MSRFLVALVACTAMNVAGVVFGFWWLPFVTGVLVALLVGRVRLALPIGGLAGLLGWGLVLGWEAVRFGIGPASASLGAIMGFGRSGAIPLSLTCLVGLLLGLVGAWLGSALRGLGSRPRRVDPHPVAATVDSPGDLASDGAVADRRAS
jgi:hypothetical protein